MNPDDDEFSFEALEARFARERVEQQSMNSQNLNDIEEVEPAPPPSSFINQRKHLEGWARRDGQATFTGFDQLGSGRDAYSSSSPVATPPPASREHRPNGFLHNFPTPFLAPPTHKNHYAPFNAAGIGAGAGARAFPPPPPPPPTQRIHPSATFASTPAPLPFQPPSSTFRPAGARYLTPSNYTQRNYGYGSALREHLRMEEETVDEFDRAFGDGQELLGVDEEEAPIPQRTPVPAQSQHGQPTLHSQHYHPGQPSEPTRGQRLVPVSSLPDRYRLLFKFGVFNAVQSRCFDTAIKTNENFVVSAPTGSGKTVLFELALIRLLETGNDGKAIYIAPTRALCSERVLDWSAKFAGIGVRCAELTGDTEWNKSLFRTLFEARLIVTTPEKWDSITRWKNQGPESRLLSGVALFLIDEVHLLREKRGAVLEVAVSRMKSLAREIRFVALSATIPNVGDVGKWLRPREDVSRFSRESGGGAQAEVSKMGSAKVFEFGPEFRPCQLKRYISTVPKKSNDWQWVKTIEFKAFELLVQHGEGKPALVFCPTRKGASSVAVQLVKQFKEAQSSGSRLPWQNRTRINGTFNDPKLQELASSGVAFHHAGLSLEDRRLIEASFLAGSLKVICCTSTLAVGVNLPAHTVIILGTKMYQGGAEMVDYPDLDVLQMTGRAGRPQFDKTGVAVIVTEPEKERKFELMTSGGTILESCLHENLTEYINSEIALNTIKSLEQAQDWLRGSFLYVRLLQNAHYYQKALGTGSLASSPTQALEAFVKSAVKSLQEAGLVKTPEEDEDATPEEAKMLRPSSYGDIMSKNFIRYGTMKTLLSLSDKPSIREIFEALCSAEEFDEVRLRAAEKSAYSEVGHSDDMRFPVKKVESTRDKVFILIQLNCACVSLNDFKTENQPLMESIIIFRHAFRISKAIIDIGLQRESGILVKHGLEVLRSVNSKAWERGSAVLRQIPSIGEKSIQVLQQNRITTFEKLAEDPFRIERLLKRQPPFGQKVVDAVKALPKFTLSLEEISTESEHGSGPVVVTLECTFSVVVGPAWKKKSSGPVSVSCLALTSEGVLCDFRRAGIAKFKKAQTYRIIAEFTKPSETLTVNITCNEISGIEAHATYHPQHVAASEYPILDTRPKPSTEIFEEIMDEEEEPDVVQRPAPPPPPVDEPRKLSNGRYACNHVCKKCTHPCCRDGLAKPPKPTKAQRTASANDSSKLASSTTMTKLSADSTGRGKKSQTQLKWDVQHPQLPQPLSAALPSPLQSEAATAHYPNRGSDETEFPDIIDVGHRNATPPDSTTLNDDSSYGDPEFDAIVEGLPFDPVIFPSPSSTAKKPTAKSKKLIERNSENTASSGHPAPLNPSTATSNSDDETIDLSHHKRRSIARAKIAHLAYLPPPAADFPPLSETAVTTSASSTASPQPLLLQHLDTSPRSSLLLSPAPFSLPPQAHPNQQQNQETLSHSRPSSTEGVDGSPSLPATKRHKRSHSSPRPLSPQPTKGEPFAPTGMILSPRRGSATMEAAVSAEENEEEAEEEEEDTLTWMARFVVED